MTTNNTTSSNVPALLAYHAPAKGPWVRIGAAWPNKDGKGFALELELVPVTGGRILLRERDVDQASDAESAA